MVFRSSFAAASAEKETSRAGALFALDDAGQRLMWMCSVQARCSLCFLTWRTMGPHIVQPVILTSRCVFASVGVCARAIHQHNVRPDRKGSRFLRLLVGMPQMSRVRHIHEFVM